MFYTKDKELVNILSVYEQYYKEVFIDEVSPIIAESNLIDTFNRLYSLMIPCKKIEEAEKHIESIFNDVGYCFLGGYTQEYLGPYIWKDTTPITYKVMLHHRPFELTVNMC
ncbi:hypothetical protein [Anaeromicropila herbilytica]|uniref:Uncharacterized protein n=1 Tax=Anaeromicropila herbilytica TaxID=2785025 RepID=A0A7R7EKX7_9FIRM|nr:hypothetical protein [Anaeromicropila herbilytica]BCN30659.1 hypothetical protein bsdtb5_19540 [Anaeromicropila herbilytica]